MKNKKTKLKLTHPKAERPRTRVEIAGPDLNRTHRRVIPFIISVTKRLARRGR